MVYCKKLVNGKCEFTGGKCILKNPKTIEDYKVCPERKLAKDYDEMTQSEKALYNSVQNKREIDELKVQNKIDIATLNDLVKWRGNEIIELECVKKEHEDRINSLELYIDKLGFRLNELEKKRGILERLFSRK